MTNEQTLFHVNINVSDMDTSLEFYESLGFTVGGDVVVTGKDLGTPLGVTVRAMRSAFLHLPQDPDGPMLDLVQILDPAPESEPYPSPVNLGIVRVAFWTEDLVKVLSIGVANGGSQVAPPFRFPGPDGDIVDSACLADPDGTLIQLFSPTRPAVHV